MKKQTDSIFWLLSCVRARIPSLLALLVLSMANAELGVLFALGTRGVVNAAASGEAAALLRASGMQAALIAALLLTLTGLRALRDSLSANLERDWKRRYLGKLLRTQYEESSKFHTAELLNRMNNDAKAVSDGLVTTLPGLGAMLVRLVGAGLALLSLSPEFTLAALAAGLLVTILTAAARKKLKTLHKALGEAEGKSAAFLQEVLEKLLLVQALDEPNRAPESPKKRVPACEHQREPSWIRRGLCDARVVRGRDSAGENDLWRLERHDRACQPAAGPIRESLRRAAADDRDARLV